MNKPKVLYLFPQRQVKVTRDGPALRVREEGTADRLYPIKRIANIVSSAKVSWETSAMIYCAKNNIGINFMNINGDIKAHVISPICQRNSMNINEIISRYIAIAECEEYYRSWLATQQYLLYRKIADRLHVSFTHLQNVGLKMVVREKLSKKIRINDCRNFRKYVHRFTMLMIFEKWKRKGMDVTKPVFETARINLTRQFTDLCFISTMSTMVSYLKHRHQLARKKGCCYPELTIINAVDYFEKNKKLISLNFEAYYRSFFQHMIETIACHGIQK